MNIDYTTIGITSAYVIAVVAGVRKVWPKIDGPWVIAASAVVSVLMSICYYPDIAKALVYSTLSFLGAVGGVTFADRVATKSRTVFVSTNKRALESLFKR